MGRGRMNRRKFTYSRAVAQNHFLSSVSVVFSFLVYFPYLLIRIFERFHCAQVSIGTDFLSHRVSFRVLRNSWYKTVAFKMYNF